MKEAMKNAEKEKKKQQTAGKSVIARWWKRLILIILFLDCCLAMGLTFVMAKVFHVDKLWLILLAWFLLSLITAIFPLGWLFLTSYRKVPQEREWVMELFGKWVTTWEAGLHFKLPFMMSRAGKVFLGDRMLTIEMDGQTRNNVVHSLIDFSDTSSPVIIEVGYRIFSSDRALFKVENLVNQVKEIMDVIVRSYFIDKTLDNAMLERGKINLDSLAHLDKENFSLFKGWGVEIRSITIDFKLPQDVIDQRASVFAAGKKREADLVIADKERQEALVKADQRFKVAKKDKKTALVDAEKRFDVAEKDKTTALATGEGKGGMVANEIKTITDGTGLKADQATSHLEAISFHKSITPNKGVIIASPTGGIDSFASIGAQIAAGSEVARKNLESKSTETDLQTNGGEQNG